MTEEEMGGKSECSFSEGSFPAIGLNLSYGDPPYDIHMEAKLVGAEILAIVTGGTRPHIGAVALAEPADTMHPVTGELVRRTADKNLTSVSADEPTVDVPADGAIADGAPAEEIHISLLTAAGHKDAVLAEMFAVGLCEHYGTVVSVTAGVHVDNANAEEIALMLENAQALLNLAMSRDDYLRR